MGFLTFVLAYVLFSLFLGAVWSVTVTTIKRRGIR